MSSCRKGENSVEKFLAITAIIVCSLLETVDFISAVIYKKINQR